MIIDLAKSYSGRDSHYIAEAGGRHIARAAVPFTDGFLQADCDFTSGESLSIYFNPKDASFGKGLMNRLSFKILENGKEIGRIVGQVQKTGRFFGAYNYNLMTAGERVYNTYEVGLAEEGIYLCVYDGEKLIAIAGKELRVVNECNRYRVYLEDELLVTPILIAVLHYDLLSQSNTRDFHRNSVKQLSLYTPQKELRAKFDPDFVQRVIDKG